MNNELCQGPCSLSSSTLYLFRSPASLRPLGVHQALYGRASILIWPVSVRRVTFGLASLPLMVPLNHSATSPRVWPASRSSSSNLEATVSSRLRIECEDAVGRDSEIDVARLGAQQHLPGDTVH